MKELTKAEEQVMQYLWKLEKAYLKDIVSAYPAPSPAYTTVSTVVNVLVKKGFIGFDTHGKSREYRPMTSHANYRKQAFKGILRSFFNDSPSQFASFFTKENELDLDELENMKQLIEAQIKTHKNHE
ncbi:MAG: BlaI family penicillinase repressor [Cyclobacteriaceae bacterium]|jgi:BlaI family penicillinase repressor